jgi:4-hydroxybenzoate polyprenyltransferase
LGALVILAPCIYGGLYALNDVRDARADRHHPVKRDRPVAAGRVSARAASLLGLCLIAVGLGAAVLFDGKVCIVALAFLGLNLSYTYGLKHVPYLEIALNTIPHPLRFAAGLWMGGGWTHLALLAAWFPAAMALATLKRVKEMREAPLAVRPALRHYKESHLKCLIAANFGALVGLWLFARDIDFALTGLWLVVVLAFVVGYFRVRTIRRLADYLWR